MSAKLDQYYAILDGITVKSYRTETIWSTQQLHQKIGKEMQSPNPLKKNGMVPNFALAKSQTSNLSKIFSKRMNGSNSVQA